MVHPTVVRMMTDDMAMSSIAWSPALCGLPGVDDLEYANKPELQRLIDGRIAERTDLDFKRERYSDGKSRDIAVDVAAFANAIGGVILIGIEDSDGVATRLLPLASGSRDEEEQRIRSVVASWVAPVPEFGVDWIEADDGTVLAIVVPPSNHAPHGVPRTGSPSEPNWCWPRCHGTTTRYLSEPEIADAYAARARLARDTFRHVSDAEHLLDQMRSIENDQRWMVGTVVPSLRGSFRPAEWDAERVSSEILRPSFELPVEQRFAPTYHDHVSHRFRRLQLGQQDKRRPGPITEVHVDGTVVTAQPIAFRHQLVSPQAREDAPPDAATQIPQPWVFRALTRTLGALVFYATHVAGSGGEDSALRIRLEIAGTDVGDFRYGSLFEADGVGEDMRIDMSVNLGAASTAVGYRVILTELARAIWNGMGRPSCPYLTTDGQLAESATQLLQGR